MANSMDLQKEQFSAGEVARVIRIEQSQLQNWLRRCDLDIPRPIAGRRRFSAEFVIRVACIAELVRNGVALPQAGRIAAALAPDFGYDYVAVWLNSNGEVEQLPFSASSSVALEHSHFVLPMESLVRSILAKLAQSMETRNA